uniref:Endonuclease/exonuclease/phosphatase domain-containing protein n=1 Tax=Nicotiana tabacum TaxID=4097 RepID=A0A1S3YEX7_TOBAC|nr:PREDICTED: uncharacterized protein LOC107775483 [Nicotiana tabacum]
MWDSRAWEGEVSSVGRYSITYKFSDKAQEFVWHLTSIYAANDRVERKEVWWEIGAARGLFTGPWVVCGDFNTVRYPSEKKNCVRYTRSMAEFSDFIEDMGLVDLQLLGGKFTWKKGTNFNIAARLDRFLVSEEWDEGFRNIKQSILHRVTSDHSPVMIQCGFKNRIKTWWESFSCTGRPDYILAFKLKALKEKLKEWSKTIQGNLKIQKQHILDQLAEIEDIQELRSLNEEETHKKTSLMLEFEENARKEEIAWRQRSRVLWLKEGDRNTKFFHRTANAHKRYNNIDKLQVNRETVENLEDITREIISFYQKLYIEAEEWRPQCSLRDCQTISSEDNQMLLSPFEPPEIWENVKACAGDKTPGLDEYTMAFYIQ